MAVLGALPPPHILTSMAVTTNTQAAPVVSHSVYINPLAMTTTAASVHSSTISPQALNFGLVLSPAAEPSLRKLVEKVRSGQFVEIQELLADNISMAQQLEAIQGVPPLYTLGAIRPRTREASSLST